MHLCSNLTWQKGTCNWITNVEDGEVVSEELSEPELTTYGLKSREPFLTEDKGSERYNVRIRPIVSGCEDEERSP